MNVIRFLAKVVPALGVMACISAAILFIPQLDNGELSRPYKPATTIDRLLSAEQNPSEACRVDESVAVIVRTAHPYPAGRAGCTVQHVTHERFRSR